MPTPNKANFAQQVVLLDPTSGEAPSRFGIEPLGVPGVARQVTVTVASANTALTATVARISIKARTCDMRFLVGAVAQTAVATTSHFIEAGERLDIAVPLNANLAVIRDSAATANGTLCITELV